MNDLSAGVAKVGNTIGNTGAETITSQLEANFRAAFGLPGTERLWDGYSCRCVNGTASADGWLYVSGSYASFFSRSGTFVVAFIIPLRNIVSIQKAFAGKTNNPGLAPPMALAPHGGPSPSTPGAVLPDALQIFSLDGTVHTFYNFWSFIDCYNVLDRAWRQAFQAPQQMLPVQPAVVTGYGQAMQPPAAPYGSNYPQTGTYM